MFWEKFKALCDERRVSPSAVCKELGFSNAMATHWKNGKQPNGESVRKLAEYFNVSADYLLGTEQQELSEIDFALSGELHDLTDAEKQDILDYVRFKKGQRGRKE